VEKDFDTFDFAATPSLPRQKLLELARGGWIDQRENVCLIGGAGTGKTHLATSLGLAACRQGRRVRFFTAATLVTQLEEKQKQYQPDTPLPHLRNERRKLPLPRVDEREAAQRHAERPTPEKVT
jgi:DNA replication protein DnaC